MKKIRKLFKTVFVLAVLAAVAAGVFIATFSFDRYRERIEAFASDALGEKVKVAGAATLAFAGWQPSVAFHDVSIGEEGKGTVVRAANRPRLDTYVEPGSPGEPCTSSTTGRPVCHSGIRRGSA